MTKSDRLATNHISKFPFVTIAFIVFTSSILAIPPKQVFSQESTNDSSYKGVRVQRIGASSESMPVRSGRSLPDKAKPMTDPYAKFAGSFANAHQGDTEIVSLALHSGKRFLLLGESNAQWVEGYLPFKGKNKRVKDTAFVRLWDLQTGSEIRRFAAGEHDQIVSVAISPNSKWVAAVSSTFSKVPEHHTRTSLFLWNVKTGENFLTVGNDSAREMRSNLGLGDKPTEAGKFYTENNRVAFSNDNKFLIASGGGDSAMAWNVNDVVQTGKKNPIWQFGQSESVAPVMSPDGKSVYIVGAPEKQSGDSRIHTMKLEVATGKPLLHLAHRAKERVTGFAVSPDESLHAIVMDRAIDVRDFKTGRLIRTIQSSFSSVVELKFKDSNNFFFVADSRLFDWDLTKRIPQLLGVVEEGPSTISNDFNLLIVCENKKDDEHALRSSQIQVSHIPSQQKVLALYPQHEARSHFCEAASWTGVEQEDEIGLSEFMSLYLELKEVRQDTSVDLNDPRGRLFLLAVGVSDHKYSEYDLNYAAKDAEELIRLFENSKSDLYKEVFVEALTNDQATAINIKRSLEWIRNSSSEKDVCIVFFSGHGLKGRKGLYFLCHESDHEGLEYTCLNWSELATTLASIKSKQTVALLDCCHAGAFGIERAQPQDALIKAFGQRKNIFVLTSSAGSQVSLELDALGHGAFSASVFDALSGKADTNNDQRVTLNELQSYVLNDVAERTGGIQKPSIPFPNQYDATTELIRIDD